MPFHPYAPGGLVGVLTPYGNLAAEWEMEVLLAPARFALTARLTEGGGDFDQRLLDYFDPARLTRALRSFGSTPLGAVGVACTGTSYVLGEPRVQEIFAGLANVRDTRLTWSTDGLHAALGALDARRFHLISPYPAKLTAACERYWKGCGFAIEDVTQMTNPDPGFHAIYTMPPAMAERTVREVLARASAPIVITGTGLAALPALARIYAEGAAKQPILAANLCLARRMVELAAGTPQPPEEWFSQRAPWIDLARAHPRMRALVGTL